MYVEKSQLSEANRTRGFNFIYVKAKCTLHYQLNFSAVETYPVHCFLLSGVRVSYDISASLVNEMDGPVSTVCVNYAKYILRKKK